MKLTSVRKSDRSINFIYNTWAKSRIKDIQTDQRIFNIDTVTTKTIPESSKKKLVEFSNFLPKWIDRFLFQGKFIMFLYHEWSTEKPKLLDLKK